MASTPFETPEHTRACNETTRLHPRLAHVIISHKHKFIFIKTKKSAGTSIEVFLSPHCGADDVVTPIRPHVEPHRPRNYEGVWNPVPEIIQNRGRGIRGTMKSLVERRKYYNHIPASLVRLRVPSHIWNSYYKFCVERNPWDKTLSYFHMYNAGRSEKVTLDDYLDFGAYCLNYPKYTAADGRLLVDEVLAYESLDAQLHAVFDRLGIPFDGKLPVKAKSDYRTDRRSYREVYTASQRDAVQRAFEREIDMHGYEF